MKIWTEKFLDIVNLINYNEMKNKVQGNQMNEEEKNAWEISFCRLNMNMKRELPIRPSEMGLLIFIVESKHEVTPVMAAEFFKVSKPMVAAMVKKLCKMEYIRKVPSTEDKRKYLLVPGEKAIELVKETHEEYLRNMTLLQKGMGEEDFTTFIGLLREANQILERE